MREANRKDEGFSGWEMTERPLETQGRLKGGEEREGNSRVGYLGQQSNMLIPADRHWSYHWKSCSRW